MLEVDHVLDGPIIPFDLSLIRTLLNKAVKWGLLSVNKVRGIEMFPEPPKRNVYLTQEEVTELISYRWINSQLNRVIRELGLTTENGQKFRFHDFRHLFATWLHRPGVSLDDLRFRSTRASLTKEYQDAERIIPGTSLPRLMLLKCAGFAVRV